MQCLERQIRTCIACKEIKPFSFFYKNIRTSTGVGNVCKECIREISRKRYLEKGAIMRAQMAAQRANSYEHRIAIERKSREKNKEKYRQKKNEREAIRRKAILQSKYVVSKKEISSFYRKPCFNCGSTNRLTIDHIIPLSRGGTHSIGNLMTLCSQCNFSKGNRLLVEWRNRPSKERGK
jgi:5-methylcytosine-specific restriction endonuclease McrA